MNCAYYPISHMHAMVNAPKKYLSSLTPIPVLTRVSLLIFAV